VIAHTIDRVPGCRFFRLVRSYGLRTAGRVGVFDTLTSPLQSSAAPILRWHPLFGGCLTMFRDAGEREP